MKNIRFVRARLFRPREPVGSVDLWALRTGGSSVDRHAVLAATASLFVRPHRRRVVIASGPDLLRLVILPVFAWAAWRDIRTRRLPNRLWPPLLALGVVLLGWEALQFWPFETLVARLFLLQVAISLLFVAPLGYAFWWLGAFGGADAKALISIAVLLPTFPSYIVGDTVFPVAATQSGVFSLTVLTNTALLAMAVPPVLALSNAARGAFSPIAMFLARPVAVDALSEHHGRLFETPDGIGRGLDLDALRMYLRWRNTTLAALRDDPATHRDPTSIGDTADPTDGAAHLPTPPATVSADGVGPSAADPPETRPDDDGIDAERLERSSDDDETDSVEADLTGSDPVDTDPWGADRFFDEIDRTAYGSTPESLRAALELLSQSDRETVWVSPGLPFIVPMFFGLLIAFGYGDLLFGLLGRLGFV